MKPQIPIDVVKMRQSMDRAARLLRVLSNPDRLLLMCHLSSKESCVSDLEVATSIVQPTLSQQLAVLREEGLVSTRRDGKQIFYSLASDDALALMQTLYSRFCA
ncbi:MAG: metalloregulator ArsR/SmtB family transcription factor [Burkholderiaceae bacterium]